MEGDAEDRRESEERRELEDGGKYQLGVRERKMPAAPLAIGGGCRGTNRRSADSVLNPFLCLTAAEIGTGRVRDRRLWRLGWKLPAGSHRTHLPWRTRSTETAARSPSPKSWTGTRGLWGGTAGHCIRLRARIIDK
jgi:hypothetical protein